MCNLYNLTTNQQAIRDVARAMTDSLGNLGTCLDIYPDRPAPVMAIFAELVHQAGQKEAHRHLHS